MRLPLFPLHQVMFPNEVVALHIFEPRYRQMLKDVLAGDRTFGIVLIRSGWESGEPADPYEIGTTALIRDSEIFPDGRANISVVGQRRFKISRLYTDLPYLSAEYELLDEALGQPPPDEREIEGLRKGFRAYFRAFGGGEPQALDNVLPDDPADLINWLCFAINVSLNEKQRLLEMPPAIRVNELMGILVREVMIAQQIGPSAAVRPRIDTPSAN